MIISAFFLSITEENGLTAFFFFKLFLCNTNMAYVLVGNLMRFNAILESFQGNIVFGLYALISYLTIENTKSLNINLLLMEGMKQ